ncbi:hypothetical protein ACFWOG_15830 [Kitasatospora sp. NPDC058406]|uniref:hypothetical protein n=1 Tax=Kitasatospora sp. NPDC058406 TaxID=3346483 RepID=UPI003662F6B5
MTIPAPPSTPQYNQFLQNITYAQGMVDAAHHMNDTLKGDLCRAAWVQAVSALDHWVHLEVYARAVAIVMDTSADRPTQLQKFPMPWKYIERIQHNQEPMATVFREALSAELGRRTYQNYEDIGSAFQLILPNTSASAMWNMVAQHLGMAKADVSKRHAEVLWRRNKISHESDVTDTVTGDRRRITQQEAADAVHWIKQLVQALALAIR